MKRYVSLDALVAEVERRMKLRQHSYEKYKQLSDFITFEELEYFHDEFIPTLEVKEVDLETFDKRVTEMWGRCAANPNDTIACLHIDSFIEIAHHFFELGLNARKEE